MSAEDDRRTARRTQVNLTAACRVPATPVRAKLSNISRTGCQARLSGGGQVEPGSTILLQLNEQDWAAGQVVWMSRVSLGVKFHTPLNADALAGVCSNELDDHSSNSV